MGSDRWPGRAIVAGVAFIALTAMAAATSASGSPAAHTRPPARLAASSPPPPPPPPPNDAREHAQSIHSLPAILSGTTVGATIEEGEPPSSCGVQTVASVWYSYRAPSAQRIALELSASGALEATLDVYRVQRSQLIPVACHRSGARGKSSLSFPATENDTYEIRVAAVQGSQLAGFTLAAFLPTPAVAPPGSPLPAGGASGHVDRIQNINAAYSVTLREGVSYLINLANETRGACVSAALFGPNANSFEEAPRFRIRCSGYRLFTPRPGTGGRYSIEITPRESFNEVQRFHIQVARAGPAETAPGTLLPNYATGRGRLDSRGVSVLRLYRLQVHTHSNLTLKLHAPSSATFNLQLREQNGRVIACECAGTGSQTLQQKLLPGRYYAVVSTRGPTAGNYSLFRESRTITKTKIAFSPGSAHPGQIVSINVHVSASASGPLTVEIDRFDPVFGWQFYRQVQTSASAGLATVAFTAPAVGEWRARAGYHGSRTASPSGVGFTYLSVS